MQLKKLTAHRRKSRGFSIIEIVLYVGLFSLLSTISMSALFQTVKAFNNLKISRDIDDSAVKIMERLTRDIKSATSVDLTNSTFGATPGRLTLATVSASGTPLTVEYFVSGTQLRIKEGGVDKGPIMSTKTKIDTLVFYYINTGTTIAIKTELHLSSSRGTVSSIEDFYNTSLLRGSY